MSLSRLRATLLALAPSIVALVVALHRSVDDTVPMWVYASGGLAAALVAVGAAIGPREGRGRLVATLGLLLAGGVAAPALRFEPARALGVAIGLTLLIARLWHRPGRRVAERSSPRLRSREAAVTASGLALATLVIAGLSPIVPGLWMTLSICGSMAVAAVYALLWSGREEVAARWLVRGAIATALAGAGLAAIAGVPMLAAVAAATPAIVCLAVAAGRDRRGLLATWFEPIMYHPARLLVATFLALSLLGTVLLALPICAADGTNVGLMEAAFTAVSAVCVTGLIVLDTPNAFSAVGQGAILLLMQVGALGIMTFATAALGLLGRRLSVRQEGAVAGLLSSENRADLFGVLRRTLILTVAFEAAGAVVLFAAFVAQGDGMLPGLWRAVFTAISAFCNAGFALQTDSLIPYQQSPVVLHTVAVLIIAGGLSPLALSALPRAGRAPVSLQVKLIYAVTAILLVVGFVLFGTLEWSKSLAHLSWWDRFHNAWFQSVTLRTAGFNSVDFGGLNDATLTVMMGMMFIGGSPGGTAGGIKTTTVAVLVLAVMAAIRGRPEAQVFHRRIPHDTVYKATAIATMALVSGIAILVILQVTQKIPAVSAAFEVVSALGTVGLSIGATAALDDVGKLIIMACMFIGRVGPLTAFLFLSERRHRQTWRLPEEPLEVG